MAEKIIRKTFRYRIYPSKAQATRLRATLALCCELYNAALQERRDAWKIERKSISNYDQIRQLPGIKQVRPELKEVRAQVLEDVLRRVDLAFQAFFRRVGSERKAGYPRFRSSRRYDSITFRQIGRALNGNQLRLTKVGNVRIKLHRPVEGEIKTVTITRSTTGKWYACFSTKITLGPTKANPAVIGIDVGLTHFATLSTGEKVDNPRFFSAEEKALARAARKLSREKTGTPLQKRRRRVVATVHERIKFRRHNFAHQLSRYLVNRFGLIVFEDLDIANLIKNHYLAKSIADAAWNQLFQFTIYKAENAGGMCIQIEPRNTSKLTACCGELVDLTLKDRVIHCPKCHSETDRDWNASLNILALGLQSIGADCTIEAPA